MRQLRQTATALLLAALFAVTIHAQKYLERELEGYTNPEELVTLSEEIPFNQAIEVISKVSERMTGKAVLSTANINDPIGLEIVDMPYWKAMVIITQYNNLKFEERPDVIVISNKDQIEELPETEYAAVDSREVKISALFFEANVSEMKQRGINWQLLLSQAGLDIGGDFVTLTTGNTDDEGGGDDGESSSGEQKPPDFTLSTASEFEMGGFKGTATTAFRFFENNNLGEIIARPSVTVRNKQQGRIQIGSDISIKQRDFAGNIIDVFISTGTIIEVVPYIYTEDGIDYVLLKLDVERSSANPGDLTTEIQKTKATTEVLMLNGEETVIGGLFVNIETEVRRGIPILKDLPWWFFGIRYLTGYDETQISKREVIILIQTEIVPTLKERITQKKEDINLIQKTRDEATEYIKKYQSKEGEDEE